MDDMDHIAHDLYTEEHWGGWREVTFWTVALLLNFGLILYAAWRLAVKHTEATGSSVLVPMKQEDTSATSTAVQNARKRVGKQSLPW